MGKFLKGTGMSKRPSRVIVGLALAILSFPALAEDRTINLENAYNVRDLGGYDAGDGRKVRWHALYRSGDLHSLSENDVETLRQRGIKTVVDFRTDRERELEPHRLPETVEQVITLPITPGNVIEYDNMTADDAVEAMRTIYRYIVNEGQPEYTILFQTLADPANTPLLFNCSAGKDRTGIAAALVLSALGVDRETVFEDYLLSEACLKGKYQSQIDLDPEGEPFYTVRREFLEAAFDEIDTRYGGMESYLQKQLKVDTALLRSLYTVPE